MDKRKNPAAVHLGRKGGKARLTKMTAEQRQAIARKGANARWGKTRDKSRAPRPAPAAGTRKQPTPAPPPAPVTVTSDNREENAEEEGSPLDRMLNAFLDQQLEE